MEIQDNGYVKVRLVLADGEAVEREIDLFEANAGVEDVIRAALKADSSDRVMYEGLVELLRKFGFPTVSWGAAYRWMEGIREAVAGFKKKGEGLSTPSSPDSTESTPGT